MNEAAAPDAARIDVVAHLALQVGRLLLENGADTGQVQNAVARFAAAYGCEANLMVSYEALLLTAVSGGHFRTKIGHRVRAMNVGMRSVGLLGDLVADAQAGRLALADVQPALDAIEARPPEYGRWVTVLAVGLAAGCLSRLFGGDWPTFAVSALAGGLGMWVRQELRRRHANPFATPFLAAAVSGIVGGVAVRLGLSGAPALCLVAPGMVIVPGVPLINGVQDMMRNHMTLGISRLGFGGVITAAIAMGLFAATVVTGAAIPVEEAARSIPILQDAVFSGLAVLGYAALHNVPARALWACMLCGVASHTLRTICVHMGVDIVAGSLIGALVVGCLAQGFARYFHAPAATFAFPGVVAMIPGSYAFRAVLGALRIVNGTGDPALLAATLGLSATVVMMTAAIAIGVAAPASLLGAAQPGPGVFPRGR